MTLAARIGREAAKALGRIWGSLPSLKPFGRDTLGDSPAWAMTSRLSPFCLPGLGWSPKPVSSSPDPGGVPW